MELGAFFIHPVPQEASLADTWDGGPGEGGEVNPRTVPDGV